VARIQEYLGLGVEYASRDGRVADMEDHLRDVMDMLAITTGERAEGEVLADAHLKRALDAADLVWAALQDLPSAQEHWALQARVEALERRQQVGATEEVSVLC